MSLEEIRKETEKEQEEYKKYNQGFLTSWADRANIYKKISKLVQPYFEKMLDAVVDFCLDIRKDKSDVLMEKTIDKMVDVLNSYIDATENVRKESNNNFYKEDKEVDVIEKDPKEFYLSSESIDEINSGDVFTDFVTYFNKTDESSVAIEFNNGLSRSESRTEYKINKDMNGSYIFLSLKGHLKKTAGTKEYNPEWSELLLHGLPDNKLEIIERRDSKNPNVIDFGDIINHIFIDSDIYVVDEKDTCDSKISYYSDKINSLESLKKYFKGQGKEVNSSIDEGIEYYKKRLKWAEEDERKCRNKKCEMTPEESSAIDTIEQAIKEAEEIIKNNAES